MKTLQLLLWTLAMPTLTIGQTFYPDPHGDQHNTASGWMKQSGQKVTHDLQPATELKAYSEGYGMDIWLLGKSTFKLSRTVSDTATNSNDTTFCVSLEASGTNSADRNPTPYLPLPYKTNFYYPHAGGFAEDVLSFHREVYWDTWPGISMQFYTSRGGPKLALVCEPGSDPEDIELQVSGQDSLGIDENGMLKMYIKGKWFVLKQAEAYQVDNFNNIIPLNWYPEYNEINGNGLFTFNFESYDTSKPLILSIGGLNLGAWEPDLPGNMLWSTYAGSNSGDEFMATDVDNDGNAYATGYTYQPNFPVGTGYQVHPANDPSFAGSEDVVTMKFAATNKQIQWATFHGGSGSNVGTSDVWRGVDKAYDIAVYKGADEGLEYTFVAGSTHNTDFPVVARTGTRFEDADETAFAGGGNDQEAAAFILAYKNGNGRLDWSTTLGPDGDIWHAYGLGVDILDDGTLVWAGRIASHWPANNTYPLVTPSGAFSRTTGGGFFVQFNADFQIEWNTFFGNQGAESGVMDVKLGRSGGGNGRKAYLTGLTSVEVLPTFIGLDVYQAPGSTGFYQPNYGGGMRDAYFAVLDLDAHRLQYSTHWGGSGDDYGIALEVLKNPPHGDPYIWVGGLSKSTNLGTTQLPAPPVGGVHETTNAGDADALLLCFSGGDDVDLLYGTLYGGSGSDAVLDLAGGDACDDGGGNCMLYATGETRSGSGIILAENDALYQQNDLGNIGAGNKLDAFLLALNTATKAPHWTTYFGGTHTDKGQGVAASATELYLVGGTISDQTSFPLKEFNTNALEDWYDGDLLNNIGTIQPGYYNFSYRCFNEPFAAEVLQGDQFPGGITYDGYIAAFGVSPSVSVAADPMETRATHPTLVDASGIWQLAVPASSAWLYLYDATGKLLEVVHLPPSQGSATVDLRNWASGIYLISIQTEAGGRHATKLMKP